MLLHHNHLRHNRQRRGVLLIVVLAMLTLFAIVGITFVFFAGSQAEYARIVADTNVAQQQLTDDGLDAFNAFLASLIYPTPPPQAGAPNLERSLYNPLRGHDLTTTMYSGRTGSTTAWSGVGTFSETIAAPDYAGLDRRQLVNYSLMPGMIGLLLLDPEFSNPAGRSLNSPPTGAFIPKNPPYTYPDVKDFYLASICPATGEVLLPSFYRPHLFGPLDPSNPNWNNPQGKFLILRPRPAEHPNFPPVPPNADGTYTGDVQNLPGGVGVAKNDSLWMDIGLPPIPGPNGKRYKPLVAPLIIDLDGLLNLSVHGNIPNNDPTQPHRSGNGLGPWEVSLERTFAAFGGNPAEARNLIRQRNGGALLMNRSGQTARPFAPRRAPDSPFPTYAQVPWNGFASSSQALLVPGQGGTSMYLDAPGYNGDFLSANNSVINHPSLYNPAHWPKSPNANRPRTFSLGDLKLLHFAYAAYPPVYDPTLEVGITAPTILRGNSGPFPPPLAGQNTPNPHRRNPAHRNRMLFTTYSYSLDRPGILVTPNHPPFALSPINLNRPLADYRNDPSQPLGPNNIGNVAQAHADRQQLAKEIFLRFLICDRSNLPPTAFTITDPLTETYTINAPPNSQEYMTIQAWAQLAVNIVDYIDDDDIMTDFHWNPANPNEVVYGIEKPRLVINEVYAEVTNDPADPTFNGGAMPQPAASPAHVRFWVELQNPGRTPYAAGQVGPLGDGSAVLRAAGPGGTYSVYILQVTQNAGNAVSDNLRTFSLVGGNPTGDPGVPPQLTFDFSPADGTGLERILPANGNPAGGIVVCAANVPMVRGPEFNPVWPMAAPVIAATPPGGAAPLTYTTPLPLAILAGKLNPILKDHVVLLRRLANPYNPPGPNNPYITVDFSDHVPTFDAILREAGSIKDRDPKQWNGMAVQPGYDPTDLPAPGDPIVRRHAIGKVQPFAGRCEPQPPVQNTEYPIYAFPPSMVVRQDPVDNTGNPVPGVRHTFLRQNSRGPNPPAGPTYVDGSQFTPPQADSLTDTLMTPFEWIVHLDRPLINQSELFQVAAVKPHGLLMSWLNLDPTTNRLQRKGTLQELLPAYYRVFDLLRVEPHISGVPMGGRLPGRININTIQDKRVWDALFDANGGNSFHPAFVDQAWNALIGTRTRNVPTRTAADGTVHFCPVPGPTVYDMNAADNGGMPPIPHDRPFLMFGVPQIGTAPNTPTLVGGSATAFGGTVTANDTLLRYNPNTGTPALFNTSSTNAIHSYQQVEPFRKIFNNVTTVSHTFAVWVTVGYFEVEAEIPLGPGLPPFRRLGREYYREVPGDSRHQFFAVVDRSHIAIDINSYVAAITGNNMGLCQHATTTPFFTTLEANAPAGTNTITVYLPLGMGWGEGGQAVPISTGQQLAIGFGNSMEIVQVQAVSAPDPQGRVTLTVIPVLNPNPGQPLRHNHYAGDCVSNVIPGNPGPQPNFQVQLPQYQPVVPYWVRLR